MGGDGLDQTPRARMDSTALPPGDTHGPGNRELALAHACYHRLVRLDPSSGAPRGQRLSAGKQRRPRNQVLAIRRFDELARSLGRMFELAGFVPAASPPHDDRITRWYATDAESNRSVALVRSADWQRTRGIFAIHLRVRLPAVERVLGGDGDTEAASSTGYVSPSWTLDEHTDVDALTGELSALWTAKYLPWFECNRTVAGACASIIEHGGRPSIAFHLAAGDRPAARAALRADLLWQRNNSSYVEHLLALALRNDLLQASTADRVRAALRHHHYARALDRILAAHRE